MSGAAHITGNLIDSDAIITSSTEKAAFPHANMHDQIFSLPFQWDSTSGGFVEFDFLVAVAFDSIFIGNHNFDPSVTLDVAAGAVPDPPGSIAAPLYRLHNIWHDLGSQNARHLRLTVLDSNTVNSGFGQLVIKTRTALPASPRYGLVAGQTSADLFMETQRRQAWVFHLAEQEMREYRWRILESQLSPFEDLFREVQGRVVPFVYIPDTALDESLYVRIAEADHRQEELDEPMSEPGFEVSVKIRQESFGELLTG